MKQKYQEYLKLNKNVLIGFLGSIIISAIAADYFADQADYLNSSFTLIIDYVVFFSIFGGLGRTPPETKNNIFYRFPAFWAPETKKLLVFTVFHF